MSKFRFGFNINGNNVGDETYFLNFIEKLRPSWVLVMSNQTLANKIIDRTNGQTTVIDRAYSGHDGSQWQFMSPRDYAQELMGGKNKHLWKYILNEPWAGTAELKKLVNWVSEVVAIMTDNGFKVVAPNFPTGNGETWQIDAGYFDPLLYRMNERRGNALFATHEYAGIALPAGVGLTSSWDMLDKEKMHPSKWVDVSDLGDFMNKRTEHLWHLLRSSWYLVRAKELGIPTLDVVITEFGWDRLPDMTQGQNHIFDALQKRYGIANTYSVLQGPYSLANIWDYYWKDLGWSTAKAIVEQFRWADSIYPDNYLSLMPFMWTVGDMWSDNRGYDYAKDYELHEMLIEWSNELHNDDDNGIPTVPPVIDPIPEPEPPIDEGNDDMVDILEYLKGDGRTYELAYEFPIGTDTQWSVIQTDLVPNQSTFFHTKGHYGYPAMWEELWYDNNFVYRGTDTSPSMDELYNVYENANYGQRWIPRFVKEGDIHLAVPTVYFWFKKAGANGEPVPVPNKAPYPFPHYIKVKKIYDRYTFQESGITLNGVLHLEGYTQRDGKLGDIFEEYWYAKGFGLVGWSNSADWKSWIRSTTPSNPQKLQRMNISWLTLPAHALPEPIEPTPTPDPTPEPEPDNNTFPLDDSRWLKIYASSTGTTGTRVRQRPTTSSTTVGAVYKDTPAMIIKEEARVQSDGTWYPIRLNTNSDSTHETGDFANSGWCRADVFSYRVYTPPTNKASRTISYEYDENDLKVKAINESINSLIVLLRLEGIDVNEI